MAKLVCSRFRDGFCADDGDMNGVGAGDVDERIGQIGPGVKGGLSGDAGDVHRVGEGVIDGIDVARGPVMVTVDGMTAINSMPYPGGRVPTMRGLTATWRVSGVSKTRRSREGVICRTSTFEEHELVRR